VHVLVVVKRMVMATMFWLTCMNQDYSPDIFRSQEIAEQFTGKQERW